MHCVCIIEIRKEVQENQLNNQHGKNNKKKINILKLRDTTFRTTVDVIESIETRW